MEEDANLIFDLEHLLGLMTQYADDYLQMVLNNVGALPYYEGYVFERWVDHSTALFVHTSNDLEAQQ